MRQVSIRAVFEGDVELKMMKVQFLKYSSASPLKADVYEAEVEMSPDAAFKGAHVLQKITVKQKLESADPALPWIHQGFMDSHLHLSWLGEMRRRVVGDLFSNAADFVAASKVEIEKPEFAHQGQVAGEVMISYGFDEERWGLSLANLESMIEVALPQDRYWVLYRVCGHSAFVSRKLRRDLGLRADNLRLDDREIHELQMKLPDAKVDQLEADYEYAQAQLLEVGITAVGDMSLDRHLFKAVKNLHLRGALKLDYQGVFLDKKVPEIEASGPLLLKGNSEGNIEKLHFEIIHWKRYLDGSFGSRTAWLRTPYADNSKEHGLQLFQTEELIDSAQKALAKGFALSFHAIGDGALEQILDLTEALQKPMRELNEQHGRSLHRIEHAQMSGDDQIERLQKFDIWKICLQPYHRIADGAFIEKRLSKARLESSAYRLGSFVRAGIPCSIGSDSPITIFDPLKTLSAAVDNPLPNEALSFEQALWLYSEGSRRLHGFPVKDFAQGVRVWLLEPRTK